jgi:hypothetical protein
MGAIMSAMGFTWCYLIILGAVAAHIPMQWFAEEGEVLEGMLLSGASLQAFYDLGYLIIIFPILGSGLAITVHTWRYFARKRHRTVGDYAITGWNTFAQAHNMYVAIREIPGVFRRLSDYFGSSSSSSSSSNSDGKGKIVILLVAIAVCGGILTTYAIVQARRRAVIVDAGRRAIMGERTPA